MRKPPVFLAILAGVAVAIGVFGFLFDMGWAQAITLGIVLGLIALLISTSAKLRAILSIPEVRQKIFITLLFLTIYCIGYFVPLPFVNQQRLNESLSQQSGTLSKVLGFVSLFS